ncbi:MAG: ribonuclease HIII [Puniceicoccales bacterium]|jgi:ribonuclease HIII|nr:ribonuclease HIII [Puniceicoccales bacterium]
MVTKLDHPDNLDSRPSICTYTTKLSTAQVQLLHTLCVDKHFEKYQIAYANFAFRGHGVNIVVYKNGKLVVQGKKTEEFVQFELEPKVTFEAALGYEEVEHPEWFEEHAGMDESGKGDLFGPLVTACVIAGNDVVRQWIKDGVRDSKNVSSDAMIFTLESKILKADCVSNVMCAGMGKYNELYVKFGENMNTLLAWMHSCSLQNALQRRHVSWGMLDQFSKRPIVQTFLKDKSFDLRMQTKAESDPVVAAASILARAEYNRQINALSKKAGFTIKKGAGQVTITQANEIAKNFGYDSLKSFIKMHFATAPKENITHPQNNQIE